MTRAPVSWSNTKKEQAMLWRSARQAIGRMLKREFEPQQETPENIRQLVAQLDAEGTGEKQE
jgi:hypothetical protein